MMSTEETYNTISAWIGIGIIFSLTYIASNFIPNRQIHGERVYERVRITATADYNKRGIITSKRLKLESFSRKFIDYLVNGNDVLCVSDDNNDGVWENVGNIRRGSALESFTRDEHFENLYYLAILN